MILPFTIISFLEHLLLSQTSSNLTKNISSDRASVTSLQFVPEFYHPHCKNKSLPYI